MGKFQTKVSFLLIFSGVFLASFVSLNFAYAQVSETKTPTVPSSTVQTLAPQAPGEGLTISPPILEMDAKPGETYSETIKLTNPTANLIEVYPKVMNFSAGGDGGEPTFTPLDQTSGKYALGSWVKITQPKVALEAQQVVEFKYQIVVPTDAEPGGHYGVVFFATDPPKANESASQIGISSMIGSLILAKTPGDIIEKGFLEQFATSKIVFKAPVTFTAKIADIGNIHFKPKGDITVKDMFGSQQEQITFNQEGGNVLPDSTRKFESKWSPGKFKIGRFSAKLDVTYGANEKTLGETISFWLIPMWFVYSLAGLIILIVVLIIIVKRKRHKSRKTKHFDFHQERLDET